MSKKGAIELSMTTVIVIILGVVLLTLGLAFVRGIFGKIGGLTDQAFEEAKSTIGQLSHIENELTLTSRTVSLKQGDSKGIGIVVANLGEKEEKYQVKIGMPDRTSKNPNRKFTCEIGETESATSNEIPLTSGKQESFSLLIIDGGESALGTYVCTVSLYKNGKLSSDEAVTINVVA